MAAGGGFNELLCTCVLLLRIIYVCDYLDCANLSGLLLGRYKLATRKMADPNTQIPRPDKFAGQCCIRVWCQQFELFLKLSKTDDKLKTDVLLSIWKCGFFKRW